MKKFILLITIVYLFVLPQQASAQAEMDCRKAYDQEDYKCLGVFNECNKSCVDSAYAGQSLEVDGGKLYNECIKANDCHGKSDACSKKAQVNYRACLDIGKQPVAAEAKQETPKQNVQDNKKFKLPVFVGEWFREVSDWISLGEFAIGMKEVANNLTIADDAIIEDEKEEQEWDQYYQSYNSLKSQEYTHEQIEATLQKPRKRDVSMSLQELDALKAKLPAGESITNVAGTTNTKLYSWEADSGVLIKSTNWEKIEFKQPVVDGDMTTRTVKFKEGEMEVKVRNNNPAINRFAVDANGFFDLFVIQTHFWIDYDPSKKLAKVGVYEGQVEIKTKSGKTIKVAADGDKPGVVIISQKLSLVKLALAGLILVAAVGGAIMILRRKFSSKGFSKKK